MKSRRITFGAMCLALAILLPQVFHLFGMQKAGTIFLPMHLPIFLGGMLLGPLYGLCLGLFAPLISMFLTGMPGASFVVFMMVELAAYGLVSGLCFHTFKLKEKAFGTLPSLIIAMIVGRIVYALALIIGGAILGTPMGGFVSVMVSLPTSLPGIIIQFIFVPIIVSVLYKGGYFNLLNQVSVRTIEA